MKKAMVLLCLAVTLIASTQELYAGRYFVPEMARWATPDPALRDKLPKDLVQMQDGKLLSTSPYVYTYDNPLKYMDPDGKIPTVVGALSGAALDIGLQVATNYVQGRSLTDISWKQVAISAGLGAVGAGVASKAGQLLRLASKADDVVNLADDATRGVTKLADELSGLADDAAKGGANLSKEAAKGIRSLEKQIAEHKEKLAEYIKNPDAFDNKGFLKNAPSKEVRQKIIQTRIKHLESEIKNFEKQIERLRGGE
ncbi:hypothetical protein DWB58_29305 [candidate division KSB1 bacterium]|nr:hypothetical protein [candidate division KSB1 bacterium]